MQQSQDFRSQIAHSMRENAMPLVLVAAYVVVGFGLASRFGFKLQIAPWLYLSLFAVCYLLIAIGALLWLLARERPERPLRLLAELPRRWKVKQRALLAVPMLFAMTLLFPVFSSVKASIPKINPYTFDPLFERIDVWIHGGQAWALLHPVIGYPVVTYGLNVLYHLWLLTFYMTVCAAAVLVERPQLRRQFFIAFVLCWVLLGNLAATLLASVGPCFYTVFYDGDPYAGLMAYLREADKSYPLAVLTVQDTLITSLREGSIGVGRGISAMPSMHVSIACLLMLLSWKFGRFWAWSGTLFLIGIVLGSIQLAYHYAIDSYASLIATPLIWWASRHLAAVRIGAGRGREAYQPAE